MDPISLYVTVDVGRHAAKKLIDTVVDLGGKWIETRFIDQQPKAIEAAHENTRNFLNKLAYRVKEIEDQLMETGQPTDQIAIALQNPDIALDYRETAIMAARTNNKIKHEVFARLLAEKLISPDENVYSLATSSAVQAVSKLNIDHLKILGVSILLHHARPLEIPEENQSDYYTNWISTIYGLLNPGSDITRVHFNHLMTTICLIPQTGWLAESPELAFVRRFKGLEVEESKIFLENASVGKAIMNLWKMGMVSTTLTTTGRLVGKATFDMFVKEEVKIVDWE